MIIMSSTNKLGTTVTSVIGTDVNMTSTTKLGTTVTGVVGTDYD